MPSPISWREPAARRGDVADPLGGADPADQQRREQERDGVDEHRDRRGEHLHQGAAEGRAGEHRDGLRRAQP